MPIAHEPRAQLGGVDDLPTPPSWSGQVSFSIVHADENQHEPLEDDLNLTDTYVAWQGGQVGRTSKKLAPRTESLHV